MQVSQAVRAPRNFMNDHNDARPTGNVRDMNLQQNQQMIVQTPKPQPHPSIFDHIQESNLAQIKAKVPVVTENFRYFGHDSKDNVPENLPLLGCRFKLIDYEAIDLKKKELWCEAIKAAGGLFDDRIESITHLICENRESDQFRYALKQGVRCVTIYWLNDVLAQNRLTYPWKAIHLPVSFSKTNKPLKDHIITVTNIKGRDRREVKDMILMTGAKFTEYFSTSNTLIICGNVGGDKYDHAIEWKIPYANCQLISDILLNASKNIKIMLTQSKYQIFNSNNHLKLKSYMEIKDLMKPWQTPININNQNVISNGTSKTLAITLNSNDDSGLATGGSNNSDSDMINGRMDILENNPNPADVELKSKNQSDKKDSIDEKMIVNGLEVEKSITVTESAPIEDSIKIKSEKMEVDLIPTSTVCKEENGQNDSTAVSGCNNPIESLSNSLFKVEPIIKDSLPIRKSSEPVRLLFTHLSTTLVNQLRQQALKLGLGFASSPLNCTHLIVDRISRTPKFVCAFSNAKYILTYKWIVESHEANNVFDEKAFILQDKAGEEKFSFNLIYSWMKRKKRNSPLFNNMVFFITPTVKSRVSNVKEMIESAGGIVATKKPPTKMQLDQLKADGKRLVVISCVEDELIYSMLESQGVDIMDTEFVTSGILRQDIDYEAHRIDSRKIQSIRSGASNLVSMAQNQTKRLRLEESS